MFRKTRSNQRKGSNSQDMDTSPPEGQKKKRVNYVEVQEEEEEEGQAPTTTNAKKAKGDVPASKEVRVSKEKAAQYESLLKLLDNAKPPAESSTTLNTNHRQHPYSRSPNSKCATSATARRSLNSTTSSDYEARGYFVNSNASVLQALKNDINWGRKGNERQPADSDNSFDEGQDDTLYATQVAENFSVIFGQKSFVSSSGGSTPWNYIKFEKVSKNNKPFGVSVGQRYDTEVLDAIIDGMIALNPARVLDYLLDAGTKYLIPALADKLSHMPQEVDETMKGNIRMICHAFGTFVDLLKKYEQLKEDFKARAEEEDNDDE